MFHQFSQFFSRVSTLFSGRFQVISASELRRIKDAIGVSNARAQRRGGCFMGIFRRGDGDFHDIFYICPPFFYWACGMSKLFKDFIQMYSGMVSSICLFGLFE
jgi:hypothetical protein